MVVLFAPENGDTSPPIGGTFTEFFLLQKAFVGSPPPSPKFWGKNSHFDH